MLSWKEFRAALAAARSNAEWVRARHGIGLAAQAFRILSLRSQGVGPSDYYKYCLFDPAKFPDRESLRTYRGWRFQKELRRFSNPRLQPLTYEKHLLYRLLAGFGLPVPEIHAVYAPTPDGFERHRALRTPAELRDYLRTTDRLPCFGKPSSSSHGFGARGILARRDDGTLALADGSAATVDELAAYIEDVSRRQGTYLFVEMLEPRADIRALCGSTLSSIRLVLLMRDGEPAIYRCGTLLPRERAHVSNARGMTTGTLSASIDWRRGRIEHVIGSPGPDMHPEPRHPETGALLEGHMIEGWDEVVDLVFTAARALSPFRMQHWDLALTTRGPVLLEMNFIGDIEPLQMHGPPGAYTEQYRSFAEKEKVW